MVRILLAIVSLGVLLSGCSSLPEREASTDCLVLFKAEKVFKEGTKGISATREYYYLFDNGLRPLNVFWAAGYVPLVIHGPGVTLTGISTNVSGTASGNYAAYQVNRPLPYVPGGIVVFDLVAVQTTVKVGTNQYSSSFDFHKLTDAERQELLEKVSKLPEYASWAPSEAVVTP